jgi:hypothetical protein
VKNQTEIQQRFLKENPLMRLGHLSSDLARIASFMEIPNEEQATRSVIQESKFFAEWAASEVDLETQMLLAEIQGFLTQMEKAWNSSYKNSIWQKNCAQRLRNWADELLKRAGFFND